jgi:hypothetical protein
MWWLFLRFCCDTSTGSEKFVTSEVPALHFRLQKFRINNLKVWTKYITTPRPHFSSLSSNSYLDVLINILNGLVLCHNKRQILQKVCRKKIENMRGRNENAEGDTLQI